LQDLSPKRRRDADAARPPAWPVVSTKRCGSAVAFRPRGLASSTARLKSSSRGAPLLGHAHAPTTDQ